MNDEEIKRLLCSAFPRPETEGPGRDLWLSVVHRIDRPQAWSRIDLVVAAGVLAGMATTLALLPNALLLLAYL